MCPFLWYLQSAVGFEYQGKTEKHASQRGKPRCGRPGRRSGEGALSLEEVSWGGPCPLSVQVLCHHGVSQAATEAASSPLSGVVLGELVSGVAGDELTAPNSGNQSPQITDALLPTWSSHDAVTFESCRPPKASF